MAHASLAVEIRNLHFTYPDGTQALRGVNLHVREGERLALLGANGAGKSTLLWHLNGLLRGSGEIYIFGLPVIPKNYRLIRQQVGLVFQNPDDQLFMPSVYDEVAFAALNAGYGKEEIQQRVEEALTATGLAGLEFKHPLNLSMGQKKRLAIASVLVTENRLLALDEPTSGLDPAGRRSLLSLLASLPTTQIIATHDLQLASALCDKAAVMYDGVVVRYDSLARILTDKDFLEECGL